MRVLKRTLTYDRGVFARASCLVSVHIGHYDNGRLAIELVSEDEFPERFTVCTVNLPNEDCPEGEVWVKDWAENEGMADWLKEQGIIEGTSTDNCQTGYAQARRYALSEEFKKELIAKLIREVR